MVAAGSAIFALITDTSDFEAGLSSAQSSATSAVSSIASAFGGLLPPIGLVSGALGGLTSAFRSIAFAEFSIKRISNQIEDLGGALLGAAANGELFVSRMNSLEKSVGNVSNAADLARGRLGDLVSITKGEGLFNLEELEKSNIALQRQGGDFLASANNMKVFMDAATATATPLTNVTQNIGYMYSLLQGGEPIGRAATQLQRAGVITGELRDYLIQAQKEGVPFAEMWQHVMDNLSRFNGATDQASRGLTGLVGIIKNQATAATLEFGQAFDQTLEPALKRFGSALEAINIDAWASKLGSELGTAFDNIAQAIQRAMPGVTAFFTQLSAQVQSIDWSGFLKALEPIAAFVSSVLPPFIQGFVQLAGIMAQVGSFFGPPVAAAIRAVGDELQKHTGIVAALVGVWASFKVIDIIQGIISLGGALVNMGAAALGLPSIFQKTQTAAQTATANLSTSLQALADNFMVTLPASIGKGMATASELIGAQAEVMMGIFGNILTSLDALAINFDTTLPEAVGTGMASAVAYVSRHGQVIADIFLSIGAAKEVLMENFTVALPAAVSAGMASSVAAVTAGSEAMIALFEEVHVQMMLLGAETTGSPAPAALVRQGMNNIIVAITSGVETINGKITSAHDVMVGWGKQFLQTGDDAREGMDRADAAVAKFSQAMQSLNDMMGRFDLQHVKDELAVVDPSAISSFQAASSALQDLSDKTELAKTHWQDANDALKPLSDSIANQRDVINDLSDKVDAAQSAYDKIKNKVTDYKSALTDAKKAQDDLFGIKESPLKNRQADIQDQIDAVSDQMAGLSPKIKQGKKSVDNPAYKALEEEKKQLEAEKRAYNAPLRRLEAEKRHADLQYNVEESPLLNPGLGGLEGQEKGAKAGLDRVKAQKTAQEEVLKTSELRYNKEKKHVEDLHSVYTKLDADYKAQESHFKQLEGLIDSAYSKLKTAATEANRLQETAFTKTAEANAAASKVQQMTAAGEDPFKIAAAQADYNLKAAQAAQAQAKARTALNDPLLRANPGALSIFGDQGGDAVAIQTERYKDAQAAEQVHAALLSAQRKNATDTKEVNKLVTDAQAKDIIAEGSVAAFNKAHGTNATTANINNIPLPGGMSAAENAQFLKDQSKAVADVDVAAGAHEQANTKLAELGLSDVQVQKRLLGDAVNAAALAKARRTVETDMNSAEAERERGNLQHAGPGLNGTGTKLPDSRVTGDTSAEAQRVANQNTAISVPPPTVNIDMGKMNFELIGGLALGPALQLIPKVAGALAKLFGGEEGIGAALGEFFADINIVPPILNALGTAASAVAGVGVGGASLIAAAVVGSIVTVFGAISWGQKLVNAIKIHEWGQVFKDALEVIALPALLTDWLTTGIADVLEKFPATKKLGEFIENWKPDMLGKLMSFDLAGMIEGWIKTGITDILDKFSWGKTAESFFGNLKTEITNKLKELESLGTTIAEAIVNGIKHFNFGNVVSDIIKGLKGQSADRSGGGSSGGGDAGGYPQGDKPHPHVDGAWSIPQDGYLATLHAKEMVVPATLAEQFRAALVSPAAAPFNQSNSSQYIQPHRASGGGAVGGNQTIGNVLHVDNMHVANKNDIEEIARLVNQEMAKQNQTRRRASGSPNGDGDGGGNP